jgi:hypothetical protein
MAGFCTVSVAPYGSTKCTPSSAAMESLSRLETSSSSVLFTLPHCAPAPHAHCQRERRPDSPEGSDVRAARAAHVHCIERDAFGPLFSVAMEPTHLHCHTPSLSLSLSLSFSLSQQPREPPLLPAY